MINQNPNNIVLHRDADREGKLLCAMTMVSKKLGYSTLTDIPEEVDPGLAALVNLLNDRANDRARQLLISRLDFIPYTERTDVCSLIGRVYFPQVFEAYGVDDGARAALYKNEHQPTAKMYASFGLQLLNPNGAGDLASGCIIYAAALKSKNPAEQDILAVSAASQIVTFETGDGWFPLLYMLDYLLGLEDHSSKGGIQSLGDFFEFFGEEVDTRKNVELKETEYF
jgi:hypothetical protein